MKNRFRNKVRRGERVAAAQARQVAYEKLSPAEKLDQLDQYGLRARRQRARLTAAGLPPTQDITKAPLKACKGILTVVSTVPADTLVKLKKAFEESMANATVVIPVGQPKKVKKSKKARQQVSQS